MKVVNLMVVVEIMVKMMRTVMDRALMTMLTMKRHYWSRSSMRNQSIMLLRLLLYKKKV